MAMSDSDATLDPREQAVRRIKAKRRFQQQLVVYLVINVFIWVIWAVSDGGFPWPVFVTFGWGIGMAMQAYQVYGGGKPITDAEIKREMQKGTDAT
jgi:uncharacterized ion transporter superfamily protein YfcC